MAYFPRHLLVTAQAVDLDPCLLLTPGMVLLMSLGQSRPSSGLQACRHPLSKKAERPYGVFSARSSDGCAGSGLGSLLTADSGHGSAHESRAKPSGTRPEHEPNGCGESRYETKRESHLISMAYCRRVGRKVNRQDPITVEQASVHHISAPHVKSDVPAWRCPVRRFMYSISQLHIIAAPQELSRDT